MFLVYITLILAVKSSLQHVIENNTQNRIYKGETATPNSMPYQIGLVTTNKDDINQFCGGSLITTNFVLTAAHCLENAKTIKVLLGAHLITKKRPGLVIMDSKKCISHEKYDSITLLNDIGLVELPKPVKLSKYIAIIKLPKKSEEKMSINDKYGKLAGWGVTSETSQTVNSVLKELRVHLVDNNKCIDLSPTSNNICGYGEFSGSACTGDSGGPLVLENTNTQIGLVSYGPEDGCTVGLPHVYTKIWPYLDWIQLNSDYKIIE